MATKNITLAIEEDLLEHAKRVALEEKTSVNAIVRDLLIKKVATSTTQQRREAARHRMRELSENTNTHMPKGWKFDREALYAERFSRHERDHLRGDGQEERAGETGGRPKAP
ncbi:MAG: DUF6364 family protein [Pseudomonadota bacterium]